MRLVAAVLTIVALIAYGLALRWGWSTGNYWVFPVGLAVTAWLYYMVFPASDWRESWAEMRENYPRFTGFFDRHTQ